MTDKELIRAYLIYDEKMIDLCRATGTNGSTMSNRIGTIIKDNQKLEEYCPELTFSRKFGGELERQKRINKHKAIASEPKVPFSVHETDYGSELPQYDWKSLRGEEKNILSLLQNPYRRLLIKTKNK